MDDEDEVDALENALVEYDERGYLFGTSGAGAYFLARFLLDKGYHLAAVVGVVAVQAEENPELALDLLLGRASRNGLSDSPTERLDEPSVAGVADELGPLVDGFGEVFGEPQQDVFGHAPMVAPLISASESDSMVAMTTTREDLLTMGHEPDSGDCLCYHSCADDPRSACSLSGDWHVHAGERCPTHPDAPGDW